MHWPIHDRLLRRAVSEGAADGGRRPGSKVSGKGGAAVFFFFF